MDKSHIDADMFMLDFKFLIKPFITGPVWVPGLPDLARGHAGGHCQQHRRNLQDLSEHDPCV